MNNYVDRLGDIYWMFVIIDIFLVLLCAASHDEKKAKQLGYEKSVGDTASISFLLALIPLINIVLTIILIYKIIIFNEKDTK